MRLSVAIAIGLIALGTPAGAAIAQVPAEVQIELVVPKGTPLRLEVQERVRIKTVDAPIRAVVEKPVYAFDKIVIPTGTEVKGKITRIDPISKKNRAAALANSDFTPLRTYAVAFESMILPDGTELAVTTDVSPGAARVVHLGNTPPTPDSGNPTPSKKERIKRSLLAQLPVRRQYLEAGTRFNAALEEPLNFGAAT